MPLNPIIHTHSLTRLFGRITAMNNLDFQVQEGITCGLLGPNGSGKTTLIRLLLGILSSTSAQALLSLLPRVRHKGLWGLWKAYDADCYLYTAARQYKPPDGLHLETDMGAGWKREFHLQVITSDRATPWRSTM